MFGRRQNTGGLENNSGRRTPSPSPSVIEEQLVHQLPVPPELDKSFPIQKYNREEKEDDDKINNNNFGVQLHPLQQINTSAFQKVGDTHVNNLTGQLINAHSLPNTSWFRVIASLASRAVQKMQVLESSLDHASYNDIREHTKVMVMYCRGDDPWRSFYSMDLICQSLPEHREMPDVLNNPKILLWAANLDNYNTGTKEANPKKISYKERVFARSVLSAAISYRTDIIIVEGHATQGVWDLVRSHNEDCDKRQRALSNKSQSKSNTNASKKQPGHSVYLTPQKVYLLERIGTRDMTRLQHLLGLHSVSRVEEINQSSVSSCKQIRLEEFQRSSFFHQDSESPLQQSSSRPSLLYFSGTPKNIGCTIVLKGLTPRLDSEGVSSSDNNVLNLKRVCWFAIYTAYHLRLEQSFLADLLTVAEIPFLTQEGQMLMPFGRITPTINDLSQKNLEKLAINIAEYSQGHAHRTKTSQYIAQISPHTDGDLEEVVGEEEDCGSSSIFPSYGGDSLRQSAHLARLITIQGKQQFYRYVKLKGLEVQQLEGEDIAGLLGDEAAAAAPKRIGNLITISQPLESTLSGQQSGRLQRNSVGVMFSQTMRDRRLGGSTEFDQLTFKRSNSLKLPQRPASFSDDSTHSNLSKHKSLGSKFVSTLSKVRENMSQSTNSIISGDDQGILSLISSSSTREHLGGSGELSSGEIVEKISQAFEGGGLDNTKSTTSTCPDHFQVSLYDEEDGGDSQSGADQNSSRHQQIDQSLRVYQLQTLAVCESRRDVQRGIEQIDPDLKLYSFYREDCTLYEWLIGFMKDDRPMVRSFCMGELKIEFELELLARDEQLGDDGSLWMWARPNFNIIQRDTLKLSRRIKMSKLAQSMSFSFALNLFLRAKRLKLFDRSLTEGFTYYFARGNKVVKLRRSYFQPLVLKLPSLSIKYDQEVHREKFQEEKQRIQEISSQVLRQVQDNISEQICKMESKGRIVMDQVLQLKQLMSDVEDKEAKLMAGINVVGLEELVKDPSEGIANMEESLSQQLVKIKGKNDAVATSANNEYHELVGEQPNQRWLFDMIKWRKKLCGFWWTLSQDVRDSLQQMEDIVCSTEYEKLYSNHSHKDSADSVRFGYEGIRYSQYGSPQITSPEASIQDHDDYMTTMPSSPQYDSLASCDIKDEEEFGLEPSPFSHGNEDCPSVQPPPLPNNQDRCNAERTPTLSEWEIVNSQRAPHTFATQHSMNQFDLEHLVGAGVGVGVTTAGSDSGLPSNNSPPPFYAHRHTHSQGSIVVRNDFVQTFPSADAFQNFDSTTRNISLNSLRSFNTQQNVGASFTPNTHNSSLLNVHNQSMLGAGMHSRAQSGEEARPRSRKVSRRFSTIHGLKKLARYDPPIHLPLWEGYREGNIGPGELGLTRVHQETGSIPVFESQASSFVAYLLDSFTYKFELENSRIHLLKVAEESINNEQQQLEYADADVDDDEESCESDSIDKSISLRSSARVLPNFEHSSSLPSLENISLHSTRLKLGNVRLESEMDRSLYIIRYPKDEQVAVSLSETASKGVSIQNGKDVTVTAYYAPQFAELRKFCVPSEESFIQSLMRSDSFNAEGGKSKAQFARTTDDRFLIKQVLDKESQTIKSVIPKYLNHMANTIQIRYEHHKLEDAETLSDENAHQAQENTCLAKILGFYQVRTVGGGKDSSFMFLVSENVFYGCLAAHNIAYDLKGLFHNRRKDHNRTPSTEIDAATQDQITQDIQDTVDRSQQGVSSQNRIVHIGLDENLRDAVQYEPLMLEMSCYALLRSTLERDTGFLAESKIIDYSLLLAKAVQNDKQPFIVVGIVDYLQPYTMKKHLESQIKTIKNKVTKGGELPTIISPEKYRRRFLDGILKLLSQIPASNDSNLKTQDTQSSEFDKPKKKKAPAAAAAVPTYQPGQQSDGHLRENLSQKLLNLQQLEDMQQSNDGIESPFVQQILPQL